MKIDTIIINESAGTEDLYPFTINHCSWEIRCGAMRLFEKVRSVFPEARIVFNGRENHLNSFLARFQCDSQEIARENVLVISGETLFTHQLRKRMEEAYTNRLSGEKQPKAAIFVKKLDEEVVPSFIQSQFQGFPFALYIPAGEMVNPNDKDRSFLPKLMDMYYQMLPKIEIEGAITLRYLWDAIKHNPKAIEDDLLSWPQVHPVESDYPGAHFLNVGSIVIGRDVKIYPGVVIDAEEGPVIIGNGVKILPNSVIIGPCFIGDNSTIKAGAKIYEGTSIGETCKVGGEVEATIIHALSNKQHEGFLGHSYIGEWVNLGADTNNSDLKNTYENIKMNLEGRIIDSGSMFLGLLCGDHTKTAINTSFTTGTVAGVCGILVHDGTLPSVIPSFAWTGRKNSPVYKLDKALDVARRVMARRGKELLPEEELLLRLEHEKISAAADK